MITLSIYDILISLVYIVVILTIGLIIKKIKKSDIRYEYFLHALSIKLFAGLCFALITVYYYKGGDTIVFFNASEGMAQAILNDFSNIELLLLNASDFNPAIHDFSPNYNYILKAPDVLSIVKISSVFYLFSLGSYLSASLIFALFSFIGLWLAYINFCKLYPNLTKQFIIAFFCIPSSLLWCSGILKDTLIIGFIGFILYCFSNIFIFKKKHLLSFILILISSYFILVMKPYVLYVLFPCLFIWIQAIIKNKIKDRTIRLIITPLLFSLILALSYFSINSFSKGAGKYQVENLEQVLIGFQSWHEYLADNRDQSGYSLGEMEMTIWGILKKAPAAFNVTFFRPYLWEIRNLPTFLGAIEGILFLFFTIFIIKKTKGYFFKTIFQNDEAKFLILFSIIFGIMVGISSYNFGALSRYKAPAVLFYTLFLFIIKHNVEKSTINIQIDRENSKRVNTREKKLQNPYN